MTLLLPSLQAERIRRSIVDYLSTTFALTDAEPRRVLTDFLQDEEQGVFVGPFVRLRLPYLAASARPGTTDPAHPTDRLLDWDPGLTPYQHQEDSYRRLTTKGGHRPEPTIVLHQLNSSSVDILVRAWVASSDLWAVYWDFNERVYAAFNEQGIGFPFPQLTLHQGK